MTDDEKRTVARINILIGASRSVWFGLISFLAFIGVTLMSIRDADLFLAERQTSLPIIGVEIPTLLFFAFAPLLAATFSAYVHVNLARLFTAIGDAPATIEDKPLSEFLNPWLVADLALHHRADGALRPRPLIRLSMLVIRALTFWLTPLLLVFFYWRSFAAHSEALTLMGCVLPLLIATIAARESAKHLDRTLAPKGHRDAFWHVPGRYAIFVVVLALFGWLRTEGSPAFLADRIATSARVSLDSILFRLNSRHAGLGARSTAFAAELAHPAKDPDPDTWNRGLDTFLHRTNLSEVDFVAVPSGWIDYWTAYETTSRAWCAERAMPQQLCGQIYAKQVADITGLTDAGWQWCEANPTRVTDEVATLYSTDDFSPFDTCHTYLYYMATDQLKLHWTITRARTRAQLRRRDLRGRDLRNTDLALARLQGTDFSGARAQDSNLYGADLEGAVLNGTRLDRAYLRSAQFNQAVLNGTRLDNADLLDAQFGYATLEGTVLRGARIEGTDFSGANIRGAWFQGALIDNAVFTGTTFLPASLRGTGLRRVDLSEMEFDKILLSNSFGDATVTLPYHMDPPAHWADSVLNNSAYARALKAHRESIGQPSGPLPIEALF